MGRKPASDALYRVFEVRPLPDIPHDRVHLLLGVEVPAGDPDVMESESGEWWLHHDEYRG